MEGQSHNTIGRTRDKNPATKSSTDVTQYTGDPRKHYIFHCNASCGAIFEGTEDQCRAYIMRHSSLILTSIIVDEDEYNKLKMMTEARIRAYFMDLHLTMEKY